MASQTTLTPKREKFAQCIADGMTQADAYRAAFDTSKSKPETVWAKASSLMADGKVKARVSELRAALATKALWTREDSVRALEKAMRIAEDRDNPTGLVAAVKELNAMHGFNEPTKIDHTSSDGTMTPKTPVYKIVKE
jgi:hypothetical protein